MSAVFVHNISPLRYCDAANSLPISAIMSFQRMRHRGATYYFFVLVWLKFRYGSCALPPAAFAVPVSRGGRRRSFLPFLALMGLVGLVLLANAPTARAVSWDGEAMPPLPQYRTYCQTYGDRDPGCAAALGGRSARPLGADRLSGKPDSLAMAVHIHRQVVADLIYVKEPTDVWQVLGTIGTGMRGDCDDVVMTTLSRLLRRGYPRDALRATIVELPDGGGHHLILGVRLPEGEVFLDDRHRWQRTAAELTAAGYRFVAQEVPGKSLWRRPGPALPPPAGETIAALVPAASPGV